MPFPHRAKALLERPLLVKSSVKRVHPYLPVAPPKHAAAPSPSTFPRQADPFPFQGTRLSSTPSFTRTHPTPSHFSPALVTMCDMLKVIYACQCKGEEKFWCGCRTRDTPACKDPKLRSGGTPLAYTTVCGVCLAETMLDSVAATPETRPPGCFDSAP